MPAWIHVLRMARGFAEKLGICVVRARTAADAGCCSPSWPCAAASTNAAVDHITSRLFAGAGGDDTKIAEARQASVDLGGQTLGERLETGVGGPAMKRCHRHPEAVTARVRLAAGYDRRLARDVPQPGREQPC